MFTCGLTEIYRRDGREESAFQGPCIISSNIFLASYTEVEIQAKMYNFEVTPEEQYTPFQRPGDGKVKGISPDKDDRVANGFYLFIIIQVGVIEKAIGTMDFSKTESSQFGSGSCLPKVFAIR